MKSASTENLSISVNLNNNIDVSTEVEVFLQELKNTNEEKISTKQFWLTHKTSC